MARKILLVDDARLAIAMTQRALKSLSAEFIVAEDGARGLAAYEKYRPDVVICDLCMPNLSGFDFLERLSVTDPHHRTIIVSSDNQEVSRERALGLGARNFLCKPVNEKELLGIVTDLLALPAAG